EPQREEYSLGKTRPTPSSKNLRNIVYPSWVTGRVPVSVYNELGRVTGVDLKQHGYWNVAAHSFRIRTASVCSPNAGVGLLGWHGVEIDSELDGEPKPVFAAGDSDSSVHGGMLQLHLVVSRFGIHG